MSFCDKLLSTECDPCLSWNNIYNFFLDRLNGCLEIICDFLVKESEVFLVVKRYLNYEVLIVVLLIAKNHVKGMILLILK